jgi:putative ABC transport system permease protein
MTIKTIIRNLIRYKLFSGLNLLGLSIGLTSVILIASWVCNEMSYDKFNEHFDNIYQINFKNNKGEFSMASTPAPLAPAIINDVAAIQSAVRLRNAPEFAFKYKDNMFFEGNGITSDPQLFDIFSFKTIEGNPREALDQINSIVITRSFAARYFGSEDPLNKELEVEGEGHLPVLAVIEDIPLQSHIQFDYILSEKFAEEFHLCGMEWGDPNFRTYILLKNKTNPVDASNLINEVAKEKGMPHVKYGGNTVLLRPLKDIYLDYKVNNRLGKTGDYRYLYIFGTIAGLILILACINYINLTLSLRVKRYKNTSIRKVFGAYGSTIFWNNFIESVVLVLLSFIFTLLILWFLRPSFPVFLKNLISEQLFRPGFFILVFGIFLITIISCSVYPALVFNGSQRIELMSGYSKKKTGFLKSLVIFQNIIAVTMIIVAVGINKQMRYIRNKKLGFNTEQIGYAFLRGPIYKKIGVIRNSFLEIPDIAETGLKDCLPYQQVNGTVGISWKLNGEWQNQGKSDLISMETTRIDYQYLKMIGVQFAYGRNFSKDYADDRNNYIVNEKAAHLMGLADPIGTEFMLYGKSGKIIGVIKDTYFKSLHQDINPQVFHLYNDESSESYFSAFFFKIKGNISGTIKHIQNIWVQNNPGIPFEFHFLDQDYEKLYDTDSHIAKMINLFCSLAVFIACLGLFGQAVISSENRIKEIGIRKVNGSQVAELLLLLNKDIIRWIGIAFVIAIPVAWYAMQKWLQNFAYKTELSWWIFALAGIIALGIALLTVSWQSWRAATRNPVEALRYE